MQLETLHTLTNKEVKNPLRVATITNERSALFFLYIGQNETSISFLSSTACSGLIAANFENARQLISSENIETKLDVILVDLPLHTDELRTFSGFLKNTAPSLQQVPVIYNVQQLQGVHPGQLSSYIDDAIDLANWQFNLGDKVAFLKKAKTYQPPLDPAQTTRIKARYCFYKRAFDIVVSSLLLVIALPLFLLIALAIRLESKGPIFYNAKRAGRGFRIFRFYKFRTMVVNADKKIDALAHLNQYANSEKGAKFFKIANDPRITRVGRFLRNTSLDGLPQLFNVLKGDMSLVGNRPLPLYEAATLTTNEFVERFMAPAGITGLWQIKKRGKSDMSTEERINLDISYARKSNLMYDLWIMANTPGALLQKSDV